MSAFSIKIGGRTVRPEQLADAMEREMFKNIQEHFKKQLRNIRDPETGLSPKVTLTGRDLGSLKVEVEGSPQLVELVEKRLSTS
ncbi:MAG: hypothetical protein ACPGOV_08635 [Magnetovibrionaceae bacterium]